MNELINNRQVNLWRGDREPPTKYHIWIKDNKLLLFDGEQWVVFIDHFSGLQSIEDIKENLERLNKATINNKNILDNPILSSIDLLVGKNLKTILASDTVQRALEILDEKFLAGYDINIKEEDAGVVVEIGGHSFKIVGKNVIDVKVAEGNIVIDSNALSSIKTEAPLEWTKDKKLLHKESGVKAGTYGVLADLTRASSFIVPKIVVDKTGHVTDIENNNVTIRDYVEQQKNDTLNTNRPILLAYETEESNNPVIIANGLEFNNDSKEFTAPGQVAVKGGISVMGGDLVVAEGFKIKGELIGSVTGTATPKIHTSKKTEYGAASKTLYGHVVLQDNLGIEAPKPSNENTKEDVTEISQEVQATAASPLMVWNAREDAKLYAEDCFGNDFEKDNKDGKFYLKWENI